MLVEKAIKHFQDEEGNELDDVIEFGKSIVTKGGTFRERENVKVVTEKGDVFEGMLFKVSTLAPSSPKELVILDEHGVKHVIKYCDIVEKDGLTLIQDEDSEENEDD
jgi:hypothetical protein